MLFSSVAEMILFSIVILKEELKINEMKKIKKGNSKFKQINYHFPLRLRRNHIRHSNIALKLIVEL